MYAIMLSFTYPHVSVNISDIICQEEQWIIDIFAYINFLNRFFFALNNDIA